MFDDINLSKEAIKRFKAGARQYAQLEFSNVYFSNGNKLNSFGNEVDSNGQAVIPNRGDTLRTLIQERLRLDGVSVEFASVTGNTFELGTMCAAEVKIEFDRDGLDEFYFDEAVVKVNIGVMLSNGSYEWAGFGVYNIDEVKKTKHRITLTGLDNMMKFTKLCDTNEDTTFVFREGDTVSQAIMAVCDLCGVSYNSPELIALTNGSYNIENIPNDIKKMTCRQVLMQLVALTGCCGRMDANGRFRVTPYVYDDTVISEADRYESELDEKAVVLTGLKLINADGMESSAGIKGYVLEIGQNDFITSGVYDISRVLWDYMNNKAHEVEYLPYLATTVSMPHLRPLNKIYIRDSAGQAYGTIITNYMFRLNNSTKLQAKGIGTVRKNYGKPNDFTRNQTRIIQQATGTVDTSTNKAVRILEEFNKTLISATGLYRTEIDGKWYFHDKEKLEESKKICTMVSDGTYWTDSGWKGNQTEWKQGVDASGRGFFKSLFAGEIVVGDRNSKYDVTITPDQFAIKSDGATLTSINGGVMTIPRVNVTAHLDFGALRLVPTSDGLDIIYTK